MRHPLLNQGGTTKLARPSSLSRGGGFFLQHAETAFQLAFEPAAALEDPFEHAAGLEEGKP